MAGKLGRTIRLVGSGAKPSTTYSLPYFWLVGSGCGADVPE